MSFFKKILPLLIVTPASLITAGAQTVQDKTSIDKLCGCFAVTFNYAETFTNDTTHTFKSHPRDNRSVVEYELPLLKTDKKVVIQHILVVPGGTVIKHWREDWDFEKTEQWQYVKDHIWKKVKLLPREVKDTWTQSVWEVTDAPRYMGAGKWVQLNKEVFWLNTTDAPLPRREYTTRNDYNVMNRTNRLVVSDKGYVHEQDNKKIIRADNVVDSVLAEEKGYNNYVRLPEGDCAAAKTFWNEDKAAFWLAVREAWDDILNHANFVQLQGKVDGKRLYEALDDLENAQVVSDRKLAIRQLLDKYVRTPDHL